MTRARSRGGWITGLLALMCVACKEQAVSHDCNHVPSVCGITETSCQEAVLVATACEHGDVIPKLPPMRVITADQFRKELEAEAKKGMVDTRWDDGLAALHLVPASESALASQIDVTASSTAAFYDPDTQRVSIIRSALDPDDRNNMYVLSHELTHYLQDLAVDLVAFDKKHSQTVDSALAANSLIEGDAVVTSTHVLATVLKAPADAFDWDGFESSLSQSLMMDIAGEDGPLTTALYELPYIIGSRFVNDEWSASDREGVDALFADPPDAVADMLNGMRAQTRIQSLVCGLPEAPEGFSLDAVDSFGYAGELALSQVLGRFDLRVAGQLVGDAIGVYRASDDGGPKGVVAWRLRFENKSDPQTVVTAATAQGFTARAFGPELLITTSIDPSENPLVGDDLLTSCPAPSVPGQSSPMPKNAVLRRLHPPRR